MLALLVLSASIGAVDSLTPSIIAPALVLAAARDARAALAFAAGVSAVSTGAGMALVLGPGRLLLPLVPHPGERTTHRLELVGGALLLTVAATVWAARHRLAGRLADATARTRRGPLLLGAAIMTIELPTAFPYLAVLATTVASRRPLPQQLLALGVFNVLFVAPLLGVAAARATLGAATVRRTRDVLARHGPALLAALLAAGGATLVAIGLGGS